MTDELESVASSLDEVATPSLVVATVVAAGGSVGDTAGAGVAPVELGESMPEDDVRVMSVADALPVAGRLDDVTGSAAGSHASTMPTMPITMARLEVT